MANGYTYREITERLRVGSRVVPMHMENIRKKLQLHRRSEVLRWFAAHNGMRGIQGPSARPKHGAVEYPTPDEIRQMTTEELQAAMAAARRAAVNERIECGEAWDRSAFEDFMQEGARETRRREDPQFMKPTIEGTRVFWPRAWFSPRSLRPICPMGPAFGGRCCPLT